jgi:hypothetical protein
VRSHGICFRETRTPNIWPNTRCVLDTALVMTRNDLFLESGSRGGRRRCSCRTPAVTDVDRRGAYNVLVMKMTHRQKQTCLLPGGFFFKLSSVRKRCADVEVLLERSIYVLLRRPSSI